MPWSQCHTNLGCERTLASAGLMQGYKRLLDGDRHLRNVCIRRDCATLSRGRTPLTWPHGGEWRGCGNGSYAGRCASGRLRRRESPGGAEHVVPMAENFQHLNAPMYS